ncbi:tetratricopeptide repeat protein [Mucilaginibacter litoreus]|uniref:Tetratricopeptide repeat protein n=1 Tax=Mucilaginibacter litoreus TaxID=1048221 RepID=A0ABW3ATD4_9SPHI
MNESLNPQSSDVPEVLSCKNCNDLDVVHGYPILLCANCRNKFINYPIPLWVRLFGAGICLILVISLIWLPANFTAAIAISRAEKAEKNKDYITEQHELEKAFKTAPNSSDVLEHLMIASFYNDDFETLSDASAKLGNRPIEDSVMLNKLNYIITQSRLYAPSDTFNIVFKNYAAKKIPDSTLARYVKHNPFDIYASYLLASTYDETKQYELADPLLSHILDIDSEYIPAIYYKTKVKRALNQIDSSLFYCNRILQLNHQSVYGLAAKARTLLKTGNLQEGLKLAQQSHDLNKNDGYGTATLAIAYHLNKNFKKRDFILQTAAKDSLTTYYIIFAKDVISNKNQL